MFKVLMITLVAAVPTSSNYTLQTYDFGTGGNTGGSSNYSVNGSAGVTGGTGTSASYRLPAGIRATSSVKTPGAATFTNPNASYTSLHTTLNVAGYASDTKYAIAISDDNFVTTRYVQPDQTVGSNFTTANYRTYAAWGGGSGFSILGLAQGTTYKIKIAALQGAATGSDFGPEASAATSLPTVTYALQTSLTGTPPFSSTFASLPSGAVASANATVTATVTTNASGGGSILLRSQNAGLNSSTASHTITSTTADLAVTSTGYGAQITDASQSSGGPIITSAPFNNVGDNVGGVTASLQELVRFSNPINSGNVTFALKAKVDGNTPAAINYSDVLTLSISLLF